VTPLAPTGRTDRGWLLPYLGAALIWGCSFLFIKLGLAALSPIQVAFGRQVLGAVTLLSLAAAARVRLPRGRATWADLFVVAILLNSVPSTLFAFGETHVSSASTVTYFTPLVAIAVGALLLGEPVTPNEPLGGLVVLLGVALAQGRLALPARRAPG